MRPIKNIFFWLGLGGGWISSSTWVYADEPLYRSFRAQSMGGAYVAIADDRDALFYNPAGLARVRDMSLNLAIFDLEVSKDLVLLGKEALQDASQLTRNTLSTLVGKNIDLRAQATASFVVPYFAVAALGDQQVSARLKNLPLLQGTLGVQSTYGVQFGWGVPSLKFKKKRGEILLGAAPKFLRRSGGTSSVTLMDILTGSVINYQQMINHFGSGMGMDLGLQYILPMKRGTVFSSGFSWRDVGDTSFTENAATQKSNFRLGTGLSVRPSRDAHLTFAFDYSLDSGITDFRKKTHFGLETQFPFLRLAMGLNEWAFVYGGGFDFWLLELSFLSYGQELGTVAGQDTERRYLVHLGLKLNL